MSYHSLNVYRSAILSTYPQINGVSVGQHPLIVRLMKGAFHLRSSAPRYEAIRVTRFQDSHFNDRSVNDPKFFKDDATLCTGHVYMASTQGWLWL